MHTGGLIAFAWVRNPDRALVREPAMTTNNKA